MPILLARRIDIPCMRTATGERLAGLADFPAGDEPAGLVQSTVALRRRLAVQAGSVRGSSQAAPPAALAERAQA